MTVVACEPSPRIQGKLVAKQKVYASEVEASPRIQGKHFLTRLITRSSRKSESLPLRGLGLNILLDGDPQAGCPAILVLTGNPMVTRPFILSPVSHRREATHYCKNRWDYVLPTGFEPARGHSHAPQALP